MPEIHLDYFLPQDVYGDDPFTTQVEEEIPFPLGLRVKNEGFGSALDLMVESAQPRIVVNQQGLLSRFTIQSLTVNGEEFPNTLTAYFGDVDPGDAASAIWSMTTNLSGSFMEFDATLSHSDLLGGRMTSLLASIETHRIVGAVLVDLPGRDTLIDFLAREAGIYTVYESNGLDSPVLDQSAFSQFGEADCSDDGCVRTLEAPATDGFLYICLNDPYQGQWPLSRVVRSDSKEILPENAWLTQKRNEENEWEYTFHLFDVNTRSSYQVYFNDPGTINHLPVIEVVDRLSIAEGRMLSLTVRATDPDGEIPSLKGRPLPVGAGFTDTGNGEAELSWMPLLGQAGSYDIRFTASDGRLSSTKTIRIIVFEGDDEDGDGIPDSLENAMAGLDPEDAFESIWDILPDGDFDKDGRSNLDEVFK